MLKFGHLFLERNVYFASPVVFVFGLRWSTAIL